MVVIAGVGQIVLADLRQVVVDVLAVLEARATCRRRGSSAGWRCRGCGRSSCRCRRAPSCGRAASRRRPGSPCSWSRKYANCSVMNASLRLRRAICSGSPLWCDSSCRVCGMPISGIGQAVAFAAAHVGDDARHVGAQGQHDQVVHRAVVVAGLGARDVARADAALVSASIFGLGTFSQASSRSVRTSTSRTAVQVFVELGAVFAAEVACAASWRRRAPRRARCGGG